MSDSAYQSEYRDDLEDRWELIREQIPNDAKNLVDIGCNEGEFTRRASEMGLFSVGVDIDDVALGHARRKTELDDSCHFIRCRMAPGNIDSLPSFDVCLLLTVYYHWGRAYGWKSTENMIVKLYQNTSRLIVQTPLTASNIESPRRETKTDTNVEQELQRYFEKVLPGAEVRYVGATTRREGGRDDGIFVIS